MQEILLQFLDYDLLQCLFILKLKKKSFLFIFQSYVNNLLDLFSFSEYICSLSFNTLSALFTTKHLLSLCLIKSWRVLGYLLFMLLFSSH